MRQSLAPAKYNTKEEPGQSQAGWFPGQRTPASGSTRTYSLSLTHTLTHTLLHLVIPDNMTPDPVSPSFNLSLLARRLLSRPWCLPQQSTPSKEPPPLLNCSLTAALHTLTTYPWFRDRHYLPCRLGPCHHHDSKGDAVHVTHRKQSALLTDHAWNTYLAVSKLPLPIGMYLVIRMQSRSLAVLQWCRRTKQNQLRHKSHIVTTELIWRKKENEFLNLFLLQIIS